MGERYNNIKSIYDLVGVNRKL